jgi:hypothetical protein
MERNGATLKQTQDQVLSNANAINVKKKVFSASSISAFKDNYHRLSYAAFSDGRE